jgi:hypothetical protein
VSVSVGVTDGKGISVGGGVSVGMADGTRVEVADDELV